MSLCMCLYEEIACLHFLIFICQIHVLFENVDFPDIFVQIAGSCINLMNDCIKIKRKKILEKKKAFKWLYVLGRYLKWDKCE